MAPSAKKEMKLIQAQLQGWSIGKVLGEGTFGRVLLVTRQKDGLQAACKVIPLPDAKDEKQAIETEIKILQTLDHPAIVKCFSAFKSDTCAARRADARGGWEEAALPAIAARGQAHKGV